MGIKVLRDAKARPYVAIVNGRIQRVRPKERYWALAEQAEAHRAGLPAQASARAAHSRRTGQTRSDDEPPDLSEAVGSGPWSVGDREPTATLLTSAHYCLLPQHSSSFLPIPHHRGRL